MELIRKILLHIEEADNVWKKPIPEDMLPTIAYHLWLLWDGGLITGLKFDEDPISGELTWYLMPSVRLTWSGQEFLDAARDERTWNQAKQQLANTGKSISTIALNVLSGLLVEIGKRQIGL